MIRKARLQAGLTQDELAARADTSRPTISAYEHGARQPHADVLLRLLDAAGLQPALTPTAPAVPANARYVDLLCAELADHVRTRPDVLVQARDQLAQMPASRNRDVWQALLAAGPAAVVGVLTSPDPDVRA